MREISAWLLLSETCPPFSASLYTCLHNVSKRQPLTTNLITYLALRGIARNRFFSQILRNRNHTLRNQYNDTVYNLSDSRIRNRLESLGIVELPELESDLESYFKESIQAYMELILNAG